MEETLWEVGASRCLQVAGAGSNGLIFSQIDLLAKPPLHPILNKTGQRKEGWGDLMFGWLDNSYLYGLFASWILKLRRTEMEKESNSEVS